LQPTTQVFQLIFMKKNGDTQKLNN